ncbi:hypothetical protein CYMTET_49278 [Cymbomonas tetramitiformis]|uniref:Uncharacterized protein n=1 Tax=Cymbomonas tetramitiformis TaxID=36881 RepID=A0AAE0BQI2_9CHLO|nr:hypothetical protein CYMTET_49278 [Cymbomonas tetramitiformis]
MLAGEDPHALRDRLLTLMERVNLPHESTQKVINPQTAGLYMLRALPEHIAGIVRERFGKAMDVTQEYTLTELTDVAQDVHARLKSMETKIMKANLEQKNLIQYVGAYAEGPTKSTLAKMLITGQNSKPNFGLAAQPLIAPRTSTTRSDGARPRLPAPRPANDNFNSSNLNPAGRKLLGQLTSQASTSSFNAEPAVAPSRVVTNVKEQRVDRDYTAMSTALCNHKPSAAAPVNTFDIAYAVIHFQWPEYPMGIDGKPMRIGGTKVCHQNYAHDQHGLPTCCMTHRKDPENWQPPGGVIDLVTSDDGSSSDRDTEGYDECQPDGVMEDADDDDAPRSPTPPFHLLLHPLHHHSYMVRSMVNHRHIPASFRRVDSAPLPAPAATVAVRGREEDSHDPPAAAAAMAHSRVLHSVQ